MATSSVRASRLRQALQTLLDDYQRQVHTLLPLRQLVKGSVYDLRTRCGKPSCHCAKGEGHEAWTLTFMSRGKRRVERIPKPWVEEVRRQVKAGRDFQEAVREVLTANAELLILARKQESQHRR